MIALLITMTVIPVMRIIIRDCMVGWEGTITFMKLLPTVRIWCQPTQGTTLGATTLCSVVLAGAWECNASFCACLPSIGCC